MNESEAYDIRECPECGAEELHRMTAQERRVDPDRIRSWDQPVLLWVACTRCDDLIWTTDDEDAVDRVTGAFLEE